MVCCIKQIILQMLLVITVSTPIFAAVAPAGDGLPPPGEKGVAEPPRREWNVALVACASGLDSCIPLSGTPTPLETKKTLTLKFDLMKSAVVIGWTLLIIDYNLNTKTPIDEKTYSVPQTMQPGSNYIEFQSPAICSSCVLFLSIMQKATANLDFGAYVTFFESGTLVGNGADKPNFVTPPQPQSDDGGNGDDSQAKAGCGILQSIPTSQYRLPIIWLCILFIVLLLEIRRERF